MHMKNKRIYSMCHT